MTEKVFIILPYSEVAYLLNVLRLKTKDLQQELSQLSEQESLVAKYHINSRLTPLIEDIEEQVEVHERHRKRPINWQKICNRKTMCQAGMNSLFNQGGTICLSDKCPKYIALMSKKKGRYQN